MINEENRVATALTIRMSNPDTIFLQEVENMMSLRAFHALRRFSGRQYHHMMQMILGESM